MSQSPGLGTALKSVPIACGVAPTLTTGMKPSGPFSHMHFKGGYSFFFFHVESSHRVATAQTLSHTGKKASTILYYLRCPQKKVLWQGFKINMGLNPRKQVESREVRPGREEKSIPIKLVTGVSNQNLIPQGKLWELV